LKIYTVKGLRSTEDDWKRCIRVFLRERTIKRIVEDTGIPHSRIERMVQYLRTCMERDMPDFLPSPVEMDETYIGGQRKNKRLHIRRIQAKKGHGTDKLPIMGVFSRSTGEAYVEILERKLDIYRIIEILRQRTEPGGKVFTDGFKMYRMLKDRGYGHDWVDHAGGELVRDEIHTNNIEGFWGLLKRKLSCIGGMRRKNLHLFVAEICWKFNQRSTPLEKQEQRLFDLIFGG
jgi:transposase-like protein